VGLFRSNQYMPRLRADSLNWSKSTGFDDVAVDAPTGSLSIRSAFFARRGQHDHRAWCGFAGPA